nr:hypothetical protein [Novosphingobium sp. Leaf2]
MFGVGAHPFPNVVAPGHALAGVRVHHHPALVPDNASDIEFVVQDAAAPCRLAVDTRRRPTAPAWRLHPALVEVGCDGARGLACRIALENLDDDPRLILDDQEGAAAPLLVRVSRCRLVAVGAASRREAAADDAVQTAPHHLRGLLAGEVRHQPLHRRAHRVEHGVRRRLDDGDAEEGQVLNGLLDIAVVPRQAGDILDIQDGELTPVCGLHHRLVAVAQQDGRAAFGVIGEAVRCGNGVAVANGAPLRQRYLIVD